MQLQFGADHDHRAARVIHPLAQQIAAEAPLFALQQIRQGLQLPLAGTGNGAAAAAVVNERVNRLLQHALLVADDDIRRAQLDQPPQAVVAIDDPAIEVIEVGSGETPAVQLHHGAQFGRNDRQDGEDHPLRLVAALAQGLHHLQPFDRFPPPLHGAGRGNLLPQLLGHLVQIHVTQDVANGLGPHARLEDAAPPPMEFPIAGLGQQLQRGQILQFSDGRFRSLAQGFFLFLGLLTQRLDLLISLTAEEVSPGSEHLALLLLLLADGRLDLSQTSLHGVGQPLHMLAADDLAGLSQGFLLPRQQDGLADLLPLSSPQAGLQRARLAHHLTRTRIQPLFQLTKARCRLIIQDQQRLVAIVFDAPDLGSHLPFQAGKTNRQVSLVPLVGARAGLFIHAGDDVLSKVEHSFQLARRDVEQQANAARHTLHVPDVTHRRRQIDMAHALAAHPCLCHLYAALFTDHAAEAHALVFAAIALPVLGGTEDALAEQAIPFRAQCAVVDRFRFQHFAMGPGTNLAWRS